MASAPRIKDPNKDLDTPTKDDKDVVTEDDGAERPEEETREEIDEKA